jgi:hypothetical protein
VRNHYYDQKKKDTVVCLVGARSLLRPEKKIFSRLSGECMIVITTGKKSFSHLSGRCAIVIATIKKKSSSRDFYAKLNVSNLNVTNLH